MSRSALTLESLFGDLNLEPPRDEPDSGKGLPRRFASDAEDMLELVGFTPASHFLSDGDGPARSTRQYDIPADEFANEVSMWGDDERFSAISTAPIALDELPEDAYPTRFTLIEPDWLAEDGTRAL